MTKFFCIKDYKSSYQNFTKGKVYACVEAGNITFRIIDDNKKSISFCLGSKLNLEHLVLLKRNALCCDYCDDRHCNTCSLARYK